MGDRMRRVVILLALCALACSAPIQSPHDEVVAETVLSQASFGDWNKPSRWPDDIAQERDEITGDKKPEAVPETDLTQVLWGDWDHPGRWWDDITGESDPAPEPKHGKCFDSLDFNIEDGIWQKFKDKPKAAYDAGKSLAESKADEA